MTEAETVVIPLSRAPIQELAGLFLGTLLFPADWRKARDFRDAWWRETLRLSAIEDQTMTEAMARAPPRLWAMRDSIADQLLEEGEQALHERKVAWFDRQAEFAGALRGEKFGELAGFGDKMRHTAEHRHVKTNIWLGRKAGYSTKSIHRDALNPSKRVIHAAYALFTSAGFLIEQAHASDEAAAHRLLFGYKDGLTYLLHRTEKCRVAAIKAGIEADSELIRFWPG